MRTETGDANRSRRQGRVSCPNDPKMMPTLSQKKECAINTSIATPSVTSSSCTDSSPAIRDCKIRSISASTSSEIPQFEQSNCVNFRWLFRIIESKWWPPIRPKGLPQVLRIVRRKFGQKLFAENDIVAQLSLVMGEMPNRILAWPLLKDSGNITPD